MVRRDSIARFALGLSCCFHSGAAQYENCTVSTATYIGDGICDAANNNALCGYDGGDCCSCSCSGTNCLSTVFDCVDPSAENELYECQSPPAIALPCSEEVQQTWVVGDTAEARALAAAVNCSGGSFEVEWVGSVVVEHPIHVVDGTVLSVTGASSGAVMDGNAATRLFTVVDATLHVRDVNISSGASIAGGAIAVAGSVLSLNRTNFIGNGATRNGGAVYVSDVSTVSCVGTTFADNTADVDGGAMFVTGGSVVSCTGLWLRNTAVLRGGALGVYDNSSVSFKNESIFAYNSAGTQGGAMYSTMSTVSCVGEAQFLSNSVEGFGGALVVESSNVSWSGNTTFAHNHAMDAGSGYGGAINVHSGSSVSWSGQRTQFTNNSAGNGGGAMAVAWSSKLSWNGNTRFAGNSAGASGGAMTVTSSSVVSWDGVTALSNNYASVDGGAIYIDTCTVSWAGDTAFLQNSVPRRGGALALVSSDVSWSGNTTLAHNSATDAGSGFGGALNSVGSGVSWSGQQTLVVNNSAGNGGGAMAAAFDSEVVWSGGTQFVGNSAGGAGGALTVAGSSVVSWSAATEFLSNAAVAGGALFIYNGPSVTWTGNTDFTSNEASSDGGAVGTAAPGVWFNPQDSALAINSSATNFVNNTSGANGGAMALLGSCSIDSESASLAFVGNSAAISGGAVHVSGTGVGPVFTDASFISNSAQVGGAASAVGSGNTKGASDVLSPNPTTFNYCKFIENRATTGGAVDSAAGQDAYSNSMFLDNAATAGGALRLAGTASVQNCVFMENFSDDGEGAAVSNIGIIYSMANVAFSGNLYHCDPGMFLGFTVSHGVRSFARPCSRLRFFRVVCKNRPTFAGPSCSKMFQ